MWKIHPRTSPLARYCRRAAVWLIPFLPAVLAPAVQAADEAACDEPVIMVVAGETLDSTRMAEYARKIWQSKIYEQLGGYYLNAPRPVATFEGDHPQDYVTLMVRFPCLENAKAFWNSKVYQETIKPIRLNPSAGDYLVTVYKEIDLAPHMVGKVGAAVYTAAFDASAVPQVADAEAKD